MKIIRFALGCAVLLTSHSVFADSFRALVPTDVSLVTQSAAGDRTCGPTALLYALKFGNKTMREAYKKIPGKTDEEKLKDLVATFGPKPSRVFYHKTRLDPKEGMSVQDLFAMADELSSGLEWQNFDRSAEEVNAGSLIRRIHERLLQSITNGAPVIAILVPYLGAKPSSIIPWTEHNGHYVVITGVPEKLNAKGGFSFQYLDPETGKVSRASIYEELSQSFWARKERPDGIGQWIHPDVRIGGKSVSSPYLGVLTPGMNIMPRQHETKRVVVTLVGAVGVFSTGSGTVVVKN